MLNIALTILSTTFNRSLRLCASVLKIKKNTKTRSHKDLKQTIRSLFFLLFLTLTSLNNLESAEESEQMVVRLSSDAHLLPLYLSKIEASKSGFSPDYIAKLESTLGYDLNHNGMTTTTPQSSDKEALALKLSSKAKNSLEPWQAESIYYILKSAIDASKRLSVTIFAVNESAIKTISDIQLTGSLKLDRALIHQVSDTTHKILFNRPGIATTHILYSVKKQKESQWTSEIWECDYDGENARPVIQDQYYNISPVYLPPSPGNKPAYFFYVSYKASQPKIYIASLTEPYSKRFSSLRGNQLMPAISRGRDKVAFICDVTGNPDLFLQTFSVDAGTIGKPQQLFSAKQASQGSPTINPEGTKVAFVSNKDGSPRIYVIAIPDPGASLNDIKAQLITKHSKESSAPSWSPDGSKLAYCAQVNGTRQIWIYDFATKEERQLTQGPSNKENPSWAPNSLSLVYNSSDAGASDLYVININQPKATKITSGSGEKRFPNWAP